MTTSVRVPFVVALLLVAVSSTTASEAQDPKARIKVATGVLLGAPNAATTQAMVVGALLELLDVTVMLTRKSPYAADIQSRIDVAKDLFQKTSLFNEKARQCLSFAHRMMTGGKKYERPKELDEFVTMEGAQQKSRKYCAALVDDALAALERGDEGGAAIRLLQLVLAVVTPVAGDPAATHADLR